jgi:NAD(P)H-dependent FMN reductase
MAGNPKILAFAGSTRAGSFNKKLVRIAAEGARAAGASVTMIDLRDYPLPVYDGDLEASHGLPENAVKLKELFRSHSGLLIAAPEYNGSITGVLKNTIDWISRRAEGERPLASFTGKVAALLSASPGALGGLRGLVHVRQILSGINVLVISEQRAISRAAEAFDAQGRLRDPDQQSAVEAVGAHLTEIVRKLAD